MQHGRESRPDEPGGAVPPGVVEPLGVFHLTDTARTAIRGWLSNGLGGEPGHEAIEADLATKTDAVLVDEMFDAGIFLFMPSIGRPEVHLALTNLRAEYGGRTVIGAVGPEHCTRVPPNRAVTTAMIPAEIMPANAPRPERRPNAAPKLMATKLTVRPTSTFWTMNPGVIGRSVAFITVEWS